MMPLKTNIAQPATVDVLDQIMDYARVAHDASEKHEKVAKRISADPAVELELDGSADLGAYLSNAKQANATITNTLANIARLRA